MEINFVSVLCISTACWHLILPTCPVLSCESRDSAPPVTGQSCVSNHDTITFAAKSESYCKWKCMSHEKCLYMNYNTASSQCSPGYNICAALATAPDVIMTRFYPNRNECVEWIPYTVNPYPEGLVTMLTGVPKQFVARVQYQSAIVPGKIHPNADNGFWTSLESQYISFSHVQNVAAIEVLTIDVSCSQLWFPMETGSSLPEGALSAGYTNEGIPLYTARFWVGSKLIYGHYNLQTKRAHGEQWGVRSSTTFDVLVVFEHIQWPIKPFNWPVQLPAICNTFEQNVQSNIGDPVF